MSGQSTEGPYKYRRRSMVRQLSMNTPFAFGEEIVVKEFAREDNDFSTSMRTVPNCRAMYTSSIDTPADQQYRITFGRINKLESFGRIVEASDETADGLSPADKDKNKEKDPHVFQSMLVDDKSKLGLDRFPAFNLGNEPPTAPLAFQKRSRPVESKQEHKERVINTIKEQHRELSIKFNGGFLDKKFSKESSNSDGNNSNSNPRQTYFQLPKRKKQQGGTQQTERNGDDTKKIIEEQISKQNIEDGKKEDHARKELFSKVAKGEAKGEIKPTIAMNLSPGNALTSNDLYQDKLRPKPILNYTTNNSGYNASNNGYNASNNGYNASNNGYNASNSGYNASNNGYNASNNGYNASNNGYNASNNGYNASNSGYNASNNSVNSLAVGASNNNSASFSVSAVANDVPAGMFKKKKDVGPVMQFLNQKEQKDQKDQKEQKEKVVKTVKMQESGLSSFPLLKPTQEEYIEPPRSAEKTKRQFKKTDFLIGKKMGKGQFGEVMLVQHKETRFICGMKVMSKKQIREEKYVNQIARELSIQFFLNHRNVAPLYGYFSDEENVYLLVQFCTGGQLLELLRKNHRMEEREVSLIIRQICEGIDYIHKELVIHRDVKPENILFTYGQVKISDFGWAVFRGLGMRRTVSGSPLYYSPEMVTETEYDEKIDIWAIGMMTYECLLGKIPFRIYSELDLNRIVVDQIKFPDYVDVSDQAKDFILKIMKKKPQERMQIKEMMRHPFITKYITSKLPSDILDDIKKVVA